MKSSLKVLALSGMAAIVLASCSGGGGEAADAELARTQAKASWKLAVEDAGAMSEMSLERMDIIRLLPHGGDPREEKDAFVTLNGLAFPVSGGSFTVQKVSGKWSGSEGDKTLHGTIELQLPGADGDRTVTGTFAVNAVTWG